MRKIKINNLLTIINFINTSPKISWLDLVNYCISTNLYEDLYNNHFIVNYILEEHNNEKI